MFIFKHSRFVSNSYQLFSHARLCISSSTGSGTETSGNFTAIHDRKPGISNRVHVIESASHWDRVFPELTLAVRQFPAVGFDCEWPPWPVPDWSAADTEEKFLAMEEVIRKRRTKRAKVSLLQMATHDGTAILVRLNRMDNVPDSLRKFLADGSVLKVGVDPTLDGRRLTKDYPDIFDRISGAFDVRYLLRLDSETSIVNEERRKNPSAFSLLKLCELFLGVLPEKNIRITCSDWAASVLTSQQISYAAADAQLSMDLFVVILRSLDFAVTRENWDKIYAYCRPILDDVISSKTTLPTAPPPSTNPAISPPLNHCGIEDSAVVNDKR